METHTKFPTFEALHRAQPQLRALLFDMDGTLFQTEEFHGEALKQMAHQWGLIPQFPLDELEIKFKGMQDRQVMEEIRDWPGFPASMTGDLFVAEKNARLLNIIPSVPVQNWVARPIVEMIEQARTKGMLTAVVTSSEREITDVLLRASGLDRLMDLVITLQDVRHAKPHPWPYLQAMLHLGVGPRETVIFEDSPPGLMSAQASGGRVIHAAWWEASANPLG